MKKAVLGFRSVGLLIAVTLMSCAKDAQTGNGNGNNPQGKNGFYSLSVGFNELNKTRVDDLSHGLPEESRVSSVRVIFYDAITNLAEIIYDCHSIDYNSVTGTWTWMGDQVFSFDKDADGIPLVSLTSEELKFKDYKLLVLVNPSGGVSGGNLSITYLGNSWGSGTTYAAASAVKGHNLDIFQNSYIDVRGAGILNGSLGDPGMDYYYGSMHALASVPLTYGSSTSMDYDTYDPQDGHFTFLMTNADGILTISKDDIKNNRIEAEGAPMNINVERSLAKVALYKGFDQLKGGALVLNAGWVCDVLNTKWYPVRKKAVTAPTGGGTMEDKLTSRRYRYAEDPNFDNVSHERPGHTAVDSPSDHFFRISDAASSGFNPFFKEWNTDNGGKVVSSDSDQHTTRWEYVTENTMLADEQYEDVTTRIVINCNYVPGDHQTLTGNALSAMQSYYYYGGFALEHQELVAFAEAPETIPVISHPSLVGLKEILSESAAQNEFGWSGAPSGWTEPSGSRSWGGLRFYLNGECYYYILIRHFSDIESPGMMKYGRYGVVRNNVYKIFVTDIKGPGSIRIPEPEGPDDKENVIDSEVIVAPWRIVPLHYQL